MPPANRDRTIGVLRAIAYRPTVGRPMNEVQNANVLVGRGLEGENRKPGKREITVLSAEAWAQACSELGAVLPWFMRRANLLVEGMELSQTIGRKLRIGPIQVHVHGETKPCKIMDEQHVGLCKALEPYCRGGVYGEVLVGGTIHLGDAVRLEAP